MLEAVEEHFANDLEIKPVDLIYKFLSTKKDPDMGETYTLRANRRDGRMGRKD